MSSAVKFRMHELRVQCVIFRLLRKLLSSCNRVAFITALLTQEDCPSIKPPSNYIALLQFVGSMRCVSWFFTFHKV